MNEKELKILANAPKDGPYFWHRMQFENVNDGFELKIINRVKLERR